MQKHRWLFAISLIVLASFACQALAGGGSSAGRSGGATSQFPMPSSVSNLTDTGNGSINFQTKMNLKDVIAFYRGAFKDKGLTERSENTAITDSTFSLVFDGDPSGKAIVVQGVDLGNGTTNVNIRYENV